MTATALVALKMVMQRHLLTVLTQINCVNANLRASIMTQQDCDSVLAQQENNGDFCQSQPSDYKDLLHLYVLVITLRFVTCILTSPKIKNLMFANFVIHSTCKYIQIHVHVHVHACHA